MNVETTFTLSGTAETGLGLWYRDYCSLKTAELAAHENGAKLSSVYEVGQLKFKRKGFASFALCIHDGGIVNQDFI